MPLVHIVHVCKVNYPGLVREKAHLPIILLDQRHTFYSLDTAYQFVFSVTLKPVSFYSGFSHQMRGSERVWPVRLSDLVWITSNPLVQGEVWWRLRIFRRDDTCASTRPRQCIQLKRRRSTAESMSSTVLARTWSRPPTECQKGEGDSCLMPLSVTTTRAATLTMSLGVVTSS